MSEITYKWKITRLGTQQPNDQILRVYWTLIGEKESDCYSISGFTDLPQTDQRDDFIPLINVDDMRIILWLEQHASSVFDGYRSLIAKNLNQKLRKLTIDKIYSWD